MRPIASALERAGFEAHNIGYPSLRRRLPELAAIAAERIAARVHAGTRVHLVGHSLGCILIRWMLVHHEAIRPGRIVLLTPPNQGAAMADRFLPWAGRLIRPLPDLAVKGGSQASLRLPQGLEVGIIAGGADRTVTLAETRLDGAVDHIVLPYGHSFLMLRRDVQEATVRFLRTGRFQGGG
jgi:pimeloyl-ACP methyl ester carboxylesterase